MLKAPVSHGKNEHQTHIIPLLPMDIVSAELGTECGLREYSVSWLLTYMFDMIGKVD